MANLKQAIFLISLFVFSTYAQSAAQSANEVDIQACTKSASNMIWYCQGYCEMESKQSCDYDYGFGYPKSTNANEIDRCNCKCGVGGEPVVYDNVPCGVDLMRKAEPIGTNYNESFCCLPAFALLAVLGAASLKVGV